MQTSKWSEEVWKKSYGSKTNQGKTYLAEEKCSDDTDEDDEEAFANYALMINDDEASTSSSQVAALVFTDLSNNKYKFIVETLSAVWL